MRNHKQIFQCLNKRLKDRGYREQWPPSFSELIKRDYPAALPLQFKNAGLEALRIHPGAFNTEEMLRLHYRADYQGIPHPLADFTRQLYKQMRKLGFPVYVHTCLRSSEDQENMFLEGYSTLRSGPHQRSCAVDIVHATMHWNAPKPFWDLIGVTGKAIIKSNGFPIDWGGDFKTFYDPAHWQMTRWQSFPKIVPYHPIRSTPSQLGRL